jgi:hypothetical protein
LEVGFRIETQRHAIWHFFTSFTARYGVNF